MQNLNLDGEGILIPMFSTPVGIYKDKNYQDRKDDIIKMCLLEKDNDNTGRFISNRGGGWQSSSNWFFDEKNKSFNDYLHKMTESLFYESFDHYGELSFTISNCWININPFKSYNISHTHPGCDYAGVLYVSLPVNDDIDHDTPIVFDSVHSHQFGLTYNMYSENIIHQYGLFSEVEVYPSEGTLLIFPSSLRHSVEENRSKEERISIAFNIVIADYGKFLKNNKRGKIKC